MYSLNMSTKVERRERAIGMGTFVTEKGNFRNMGNFCNIYRELFTPSIGNICNNGALS